MNEPATAPPLPWATRARPIRDTAADLRVGAYVVAALAALGLALGYAWAKWSPAGPHAVTFADTGAIWAYEETEAFIQTDGRYGVICLVVGAAAAAIMWFRVRARGPIALTALCVGGLVGAQLMRLTAYTLGGGSTDAAKCNVSADYGGCIEHLPVSVHMSGLTLLEAATAVLVYSLCAAFAVRDDLGRRDPVRLMMLRSRADAATQAQATASVGGGVHPQDARSHRDGPGEAQ